MAFPSLYKAKAVSIRSGAIEAFVPQVFGETAITITDSLGDLPDAVSMGWVFFQAGDPEFPVWASGLGGGSAGGGGNEVWIGPGEPTDAVELWYDTDGAPVVTKTAWTPVTFQNGWVNYGGTNQPVQYRRDDDMVQIRGAMKDGTNSSTAFALPLGFRPPFDTSGLLVGAGVNMDGVADILANGSINVYASSIGLVRFPMVQFSVLV